MIIVMEGRQRVFEVGPHPFSRGSFVTLSHDDKILPLALFPGAPMRGLAADEYRGNGALPFAPIVVPSGFSGTMGRSFSSGFSDDLSASNKAGIYWEGEFALACFNTTLRYRPFDELFLSAAGVLENRESEGCWYVGWVTRRPMRYGSDFSEQPITLTFNLDISRGLSWRGDLPDGGNPVMPPSPPEPPEPPSGGRWDDIV